MQSEDGAAGAEDSLTSTEFDRFLAERAAAAENLPTISREEKSLLSEVNESVANDDTREQERPQDGKDERVASANSSSASVVRPRKPRKQEEPLIEF